MVEKAQPITKEGLQRLEQELNYLETERRREVAARIHQAKELASTQNNADYEDAKNEQAMVEGRIQTLQALIQHAEIIDEEGDSIGGKTLNECLKAALDVIHRITGQLGVARA